MPSRAVTRRFDRRFSRFAAMSPLRKKAEARFQLIGWRREAYHRARFLPAPQVWALAHDPRRRAIALVLDPSGDLLADLERTCAEAVASQAGRHLVQASRPMADRGRLHRG